MFDPHDFCGHEQGTQFVLKCRLCQQMPLVEFSALLFWFVFAHATDKRNVEWQTLNANQFCRNWKPGLSLVLLYMVMQTLSLIVFSKHQTTGFFHRKCVCCWQAAQLHPSLVPQLTWDLRLVCLKTEAVMVPRRNSLRLWISWRTLPGVSRSYAAKRETQRLNFRVKLGNHRLPFLVKSWQG